jgi:hypothetical protein
MSRSKLEEQTMLHNISEIEINAKMSATLTYMSTTLKTKPVQDFHLGEEIGLHGKHGKKTVSILKTCM